MTATRKWTKKTGWMLVLMLIVMLCGMITAHAAVPTCTLTFHAYFEDDYDNIMETRSAPTVELLCNGEVYKTYSLYYSKDTGIGSTTAAKLPLYDEATGESYDYDVRLKSIPKGYELRQQEFDTTTNTWKCYLRWTGKEDFTAKIVLEHWDMAPALADITDINVSLRLEDGLANSAWSLQVGAPDTIEYDGDGVWTATWKDLMTAHPDVDATKGEWSQYDDSIRYRLTLENTNLTPWYSANAYIYNSGDTFTFSQNGFKKLSWQLRMDNDLADESHVESPFTDWLDLSSYSIWLVDKDGNEVEGTRYPLGITSTASSSSYASYSWEFSYYDENGERNGSSAWKIKTDYSTDALPPYWTKLHIYYGNSIRVGQGYASMSHPKDFITWDDNSDALGLRPASFTYRFKLDEQYQDYPGADSIHAAEFDWKKNATYFSGKSAQFPLYDTEGKELDYLMEVDAPAYYTVNVINTSDNRCDARNDSSLYNDYRYKEYTVTLSLPTRKVTANVAFENEVDEGKNRPTLVSFVIKYADGTEVPFNNSTQTANAGNGWTVEWDVPLYDAEGNLAEYKVEPITLLPLHALTQESPVKTVVKDEETGDDVENYAFTYVEQENWNYAIDLIWDESDPALWYEQYEIIHTNNAERDVKYKLTIRVNAAQYDVGKLEVKEVIPAEADKLGGVTYDETEYTVTVTVTDNGDGTLEVTASNNATKLNFTNSYEAKGDVSFSGVKTLEGRDLAEGEFSFTLYDSNNEAIETVKNDADGKITFATLNYIHNKDESDLGEHTYTVKEIKNGLKGVTYDETKYTVTVNVSDNGDGTLKVEASDNAETLNFRNYYDADGELTLRATKTVNGEEPAEDEVFSFELRDATGKVLQTKQNEGGKITFDALKYELTDAGKSFLYKVSEKQEQKAGYTLDETVYLVAVWVSDAGDGTLKISKTIQTGGQAVTAMTFENTYEAQGEWQPTAVKTVNGAEPREDQVYAFALSDEEGNTILAENAKGEIIFDTLSYDLSDAGKTYTYTMQEITTPTDLLSTDESIYRVDVTVTDKRDGTLEVKPVITKEAEETEGIEAIEEIEEIAFENKLTTLLTIRKTVEGIETTETFPFTVKLYKADGTEATEEYAYTGDAEGKLKSGDAIELAHGESVTISGLLPGMTYTVTEAATAAYETTVNGTAGTAMEGTLEENANEVNFVNKYKTTMFMVKKSWQGGGGGAIELTLYANGKKLEPQPVYSREEDTYLYTDLPMYDEQEQVIVYSAKEKYVDGFLTIYKNVAPYTEESKAIYDGGTIINKAIVKADFAVKKEWSGLDEGESAPEITLVLYCNGEATDVKTPDPDRNGWYKYYDLPGEVDGEKAVYTVKELPMEGYETSYTLADGHSGEYADNGGTITNRKIPQTGDEAPLALWMTLMGASAMLLALLMKRRKA